MKGDTPRLPERVNGNPLRRYMCVQVAIRPDGFPDVEYFGDPDIEGGVYFVQGENGGPIKIGWTKKVMEKYRLRDLQIGSPVILKLLGIVLGANIDLERHLHHEFADQRLHGEWFEPSEDLLDVIKRWSWDFDVPRLCQDRVFCG